MSFLEDFTSPRALAQNMRERKDEITERKVKMEENKYKTTRRKDVTT